MQSSNISSWFDVISSIFPIKSFFHLQSIYQLQPALKIDMEKLQDDIVAYPDTYNYERAERLGVRTTCVFYALRRLNITRKKNASA